MAFDVGSIVAHLNLDQKQWKQAIKEIKQDQTSLGGYVLNNEQAFKKFGKEIGIAGAAIVASLGAITKMTANWGDELSHLSQKTGIQASTLSSFRLALEKADLDLHSFTLGMKTLAQSMVEAKSPTSAAAKIFDYLGVKTKDSSGKMRPMNEVLFDIAGAFKNLPDGADKAAIAVNLFGRAGMALIPLLNEGTEGLQAEIEKAQKFGLTMSDEAAEGAHEFSRSLQDLKGAVTGAGMEIGKMLIPMIQPLVKGLTDIVAGIRGWIAENPALSTMLTGMAGGLGAIMVPLGALLMALPGLIKGWAALSQAIGMSTGVMWASMGAWAAIIGAALTTYKVVNDLIEAKNRLTDADFQYAQANERLGKKLREAADAAGMTRAEFVQLTEKYNGNNAALAMAIKNGDEGVKIQKALATVGKEHADAIDKQTAAHKKLHPELDLTNTKTQTLLEKYSYITKADLATKISELTQLFIKYGTSLPVSEQTRLIEELRATNEALNPTADLLKGIIEQWDALNNMDPTGLEAIAKAVSDEANLMGDEWQELVDDVQSTDPFGAPLTPEKKAAIQAPARALIKSTQEATDQANHLYGDLFGSIHQGLTQTFTAILDGTAKFSSLWMGIWKSIKSSFAKVLADMVADYVAKFIKMILVKTGLLRGLENIFNSIFGGILGSIGSIFGGGAAGAMIPAVAGTAAAGAGAGMAAAGGVAGFLSVWAGPIAIGGMILGTLFGQVFGKSAWEKMMEADPVNRARWEKAIRENVEFLKTVTRDMLQAPTGPTPQGTGTAISLGSRKPEEPVESLWSIIGKKSSGTAPSQTTPSANPPTVTSGPDVHRAIPGTTPPITINVNISGQVITDRDYVRTRLLPEIENAFTANVFRQKIQFALGVGR